MRWAGEQGLDEGRPEAARGGTAHAVTLPVKVPGDEW